MHLRLVWESNEFDPVHVHSIGSGPEEDESKGATRWNVPDDWAEEDTKDVVTGKVVTKEEEGILIQKGFTRREVELVDGTREVGFWVDGREARVRVEIRGKAG